VDTCRRDDNFVTDTGRVVNIAVLYNYCNKYCNTIVILSSIAKGIAILVVCLVMHLVLQYF